MRIQIVSCKIFGNEHHKELIGMYIGDLLCDNHLIDDLLRRNTEADSHTRRDDLGIGKKDGMVSWRKATLLEMDWEVLRKETKKSGEISKISNYAKTNLDEFFAECFTMYRFERENLPKNVLEKMEEFIKWCSMMK